MVGPKGDRERREQAEQPTMGDGEIICQDKEGLAPILYATSNVHAAQGFQIVTLQSDSGSRYVSFKRTHDALGHST